MFRMLTARLFQGHRTMKFPDAPPPPLSDRFRGAPIISQAQCAPDCRDCFSACTTNAISFEPNIKIDLGSCLFCTDCEKACPEKRISHAKDYSLSTRKREDLVIDGHNALLLKAVALEKASKKLFGHSLKLRVVSAGGCNACEADVNVLTTIGWDLGRFGIKFVASPRHADGIVITGPVTQNMLLALKKTWEAIPEPKIVIAVGACAISGGPYKDHPETNNGVDKLLKVDLYIPGCPPHPLTTLDGLLRLLGRIKQTKL